MSQSTPVGTRTVSPQRVIEAIRSWQTSGHKPLVVAIDGHGSSGKSTLAERVAAELDAALLHTDDFFRPSDPARPRDAGSSMDEYYDWPRLRSEALAPLRAGQTAEFRAFDEALDAFKPGTVTVAPAPLILLEGVSAGAEALADLVDHRILVQTPEPQRLERVRQRVAPEAWNDDWLQTEHTYFAERPTSAFDLVVSGAEAGPDHATGPDAEAGAPALAKQVGR